MKNLQPKIKVTQHLEGAESASKPASSASNPANSPPPHSRIRPLFPAQPRQAQNLRSKAEPPRHCSPSTAPITGVGGGGAG